MKHSEEPSDPARIGSFQEQILYIDSSLEKYVICQINAKIYLMK